MVVGALHLQWYWRTIRHERKTADYFCLEKVHPQQTRYSAIALARTMNRLGAGPMK